MTDDKKRIEEIREYRDYGEGPGAWIAHEHVEFLLAQIDKRDEALREIASMRDHVNNWCGDIARKALGEE